MHVRQTFSLERSTRCGGTGATSSCAHKGGRFASSRSGAPGTVALAADGAIGSGIPGELPVTGRSRPRDGIRHVASGACVHGSAHRHWLRRERRERLRRRPGHRHRHGMSFPTIGSRRYRRLWRAAEPGEAGPWPVPGGRGRPAPGQAARGGATRWDRRGAAGRGCRRRRRWSWCWE